MSSIYVESRIWISHLVAAIGVIDIVVDGSRIINIIIIFIIIVIVIVIVINIVVGRIIVVSGILAKLVTDIIII